MSIFGSDRPAPRPKPVTPPPPPPAPEAPPNAAVTPSLTAFAPGKLPGMEGYMDQGGIGSTILTSPLGQRTRTTTGKTLTGQ